MACKRKATILIVDDVLINMEMMNAVLQKDYDILMCDSGFKALEIVRDPEKTPDLILLDIMMPRMDGYDVCKILKADEKTKPIPIIFLTGRSDIENETKGLSLGAVDYIHKPASPAIVKARVKTQIKIKRYQDGLEEEVLQQTNELVKLNQKLAKDIYERKKAERRLAKAQSEETRLLEMTSALSSELNLNRLLTKIMDTTRKLLRADRCTLFVSDEKTKELWARIESGIEIRFPDNKGIAGSVFTTGETVNIPDAYADMRFNQDVDKQTGYRTESILCMPVKLKDGKTIAAVQVLNKEDGPFTARDEKMFAAFSTQVSVALENARMFDDITNMKNYNENMLESMSNGIISLNDNGKINTFNRAALKIFFQDRYNDSFSIDGISIIQSVLENNPWIMASIDKVMQTKQIDLSMDAELIVNEDRNVSINLTIVPLINIQKVLIGSLLVFEDVTQEKRLKTTMARYMTKEVADKLLESDEDMLGGQLQEATVLFSDIRDFTSISEKNGPAETVELLNEYFTIMVDIVFNYKGILDKYIGDAIMAVFGVPFPAEEDPDSAVKTAIDTMIALKEFNSHRKASIKDPIEIGIGINTDNILSGNIGSEKRMDYTAIGDGVNLAARLESANKTYSTHILISELTYKKLEGSYICREVDVTRVKGKKQPVGIYQVLDYHDDKSFPCIDNVVESFEKGLECYRRRNWQSGVANFNKALKCNPHDTVSYMFAERCRHYEKYPPADDWDGVWVMQGK
ncbi:adenylate/guanylate cyclase domain-containing protein [Desulfococcaceae bacterium HSG9]|nr:adenylate/guanylate cyclase domain-containing protein [Desulfococcaceae bacterium HSG9]